MSDKLTFKEMTKLLSETKEECDLVKERKSSSDLCGYYDNLIVFCSPGVCPKMKGKVREFKEENDD